MQCDLYHVLNFAMQLRSKFQSCDAIEIRIRSQIVSNQIWRRNQNLTFQNLSKSNPAGHLDSLVDSELRRWSVLPAADCTRRVSSPPTRGPARIWPRVSALSRFRELNLRYYFILKFRSFLVFGLHLDRSQTIFRSPIFTASACDIWSKSSIFILNIAENAI